MNRLYFRLPKVLVTLGSISMGLITISYNNRGEHTFYSDFLELCSTGFIDDWNELVLSYFIFMLLIVLSAVISIIFSFGKGIKSSMWLGIFNVIIWFALTVEFYRWRVLDADIFWNSSLPFLLLTFAGFHLGITAIKQRNCYFRSL